MPREQPAERVAVALALGGMAAMAAALGIGRFVYTPILPAMTEVLGLSKAEAGLIASANFAGYLVGALLATAPRLPGSRRAWMLTTLALSAATTGAMGLVSSLPAFLALRGIGGMASAVVLVFASALVLDRLARAGRGGLSALHFAGVGVGIALSAALVSALLAAGFGWRVLWLGSGAISLVALAVAAWLVPRDPRPWQAPSAASPSMDRGGPRHGLAALACAYGLFGFGYVVTATFLVTIVRAVPEIRPVEPLIWMVVGVAAVPSVGLWTRLATRLGVSRSFAAACLVEAAGVAASVLWPTPAGALLAAALLGGTFMGLTALGLAGARQLAAGDDPRRALGLLTAAFGVGQIIGPALAGYLHDRVAGGFVLPSLLAAGALVAAAAVTVGITLPAATVASAQTWSRRNVGATVGGLEPVEDGRPEAQRRRPGRQE